MNTQKKPDIDIQTLLKEHERLSSDIRAIETMNDKVVGFGLTIIGAGLAYGVQQNIIEVFFFLPIALLGVLLYAVLQYYNMFWLGGYKRATEDKINVLSGDTVLAWETLVAARRGRIHVINASMASIYLTLVLGITWYSLYRIFISGQQALGFLYVAVLIELVALFAFSFLQMSNAYDRAYKASREALGLPSPEQPH